MKIKLLFIFVISLLFIPSSIYATGNKVEYNETFENEYSNWTFFNSNQTTSGWNLYPDPQGTNQNTLGADINKTFSKSWAVYDKEFKNFEYSLDIFGVAGDDKNIGFRVKNASQYEMYGIHFRGPNYNDISLEKFTSNGNGATTLATSNYSFTNNQWYNLRINAYEDNIIIYVDGTEIINYTDNKGILGEPYLEGKIGLVITTGISAPTRVRFDNIIVKNLDELDVPHYLQTDPIWANDLYSTARNTNGKRLTIGSDGCYMTSAAMLLNYHGINEIQSTTQDQLIPLDPRSLNAWLMNQRDGYTSEGYTNQNAILRWTDIRHNLALNDTSLSQTPQLDFSANNFEPVSNFSSIDEDLSNGNPIMLKVNYMYNDGKTESTHFLVASGRNNNQYLILDPLNIGNSLDNVRYNNKIYGTRQYKPIPSVTPLSQSLSKLSQFDIADTGNVDRSAIMISAPSQTPFLIIDGNGLKLGSDPVTDEIYQQIPDSFYSYETPYADPNEESVRSPSYVANIKFPLATTYKLTTSGSDQTSNVQIFTYAHTGDFQVIDKNLYSGETGGASILFNSQNNELLIQENIPVSFDYLVSEIRQAMDRRQINPPALGIGWIIQIKNAQRINTSPNRSPATRILNNVSRQIAKQTPKHVDKEVSAQINKDIQTLIDLISSN